MLSAPVKHVSVVPNRAATGLVRAVYKQARQEIGMLPEPVTMFSAAPDLLVATWAPFRETLLSTGHAPRAVKEAVAAKVSALNDCPYCVDAHTIMLYGSGAGDFATSLLAGAAEPSGDPQVRAVSEWAAVTMTRATSPVPAPFPPEQIPEIVGTLVEFQFLNRVINVLLSGTFLPGTDKAKRIARQVAGKVMAKRIRAQREPGGAVGLAGGHVLPTDLLWAAPQPAIAAAFAGLAAAAGAAAGRAVPASVTALVERTLDGWDGRSPGPSKAWVTGLLASLPLADQAAGRLALLTAMAPFQIVDEDVAAYRTDHPGDDDLIGLLSWAAFSAARRIGAWSVPAASLA